MGDLLGIGITGLQAFRRQLDTTSHNIANVNTDGYSRQRVDLSSRTPDYEGFGYIGNGVKIDGVRRITDEFLTSQIRSGTSSLAQLSVFNELVSRVDQILADADAGLTPTMQSFFDAVQDVADDPASVPARQVLLSQAETLADRFDFIDTQLSVLADQANQNIRTELGEVNSIAEGIAALNLTITNLSGASGIPPNDLLDQQEELIRRLSEKVDVQVIRQDNGAFNVFIGSGQALVLGNDARTLAATINTFDPTQLDVSISDGINTVNITDQMQGGSLGGSLDFTDQILNPARNELGRIALGIAGTFNEQHRLGLDLDGNLGGDFFTALNSGSFGPSLLEGSANSVSGFGNMSAQIVDVNQLSTNNYEIRYVGANQYEVLNLTTNAVSNFAGPSFTIDGVQVDISSAPGVNDIYLLRPTYGAASNLQLALTNPREIAAALPVRTDVALNNSGSGVISSGQITNPATFTAAATDYTIVLGADSGAVADGGATRGTFTDNNNDSTLNYTLSINGTVLYTQAEGDAPLADLNALAAAINGAGNANVAITGVRAYTDNTNLYLVNEPGTALPISVAESLVTSAGTVEDGDTITGYFGSALTGVSAASNSIAFSSPADSYVVINTSNAVVADGTFTAGAPIAFNGVEATLSGVPNLGDSFTVARNSGGVGDNRNMLLLSGLQNRNTLENGRSTYLDAYGQLVAGVGSEAQQSGITIDAQTVLLDQTIAQRESISGVNLDEEAADLIRFQQAYQAAAQVISTANDLFDTLINAVGR